MFVSGLIASSRFGWPMIFYTFSGTGLLWCIIFGYFGYKSPNDHPTISEEERNFICSNNGITNLKKVLIFTWLLIKDLNHVLQGHKQETNKNKKYGKKLNNYTYIGNT